MIGTRTRLAWGPLEMGIGRTFSDWKEFLMQPQDVKIHEIQRYRGGKTMYTDIQSALMPYIGRSVEDNPYAWFGMFSLLDVLLGVRVINKHGDTLFYNDTQEGSLELIPIEDEVLQLASPKRARVIVHSDSQWHLDVDLDKVKPDWEVWVYGRCPLVRLQWDPGDFMWRDPVLGQREFSFFQYNTRLGRHILMAAKNTTISAEVYWRNEGMETQFIAEFWKHFWDIEQAWKVRVFHWQLIYRAVPVNEWLKGQHLQALCVDYGLASESVRHCLWDFVYARKVWQRLLRIFQFQKMYVNVSWGSVVWMTLRNHAFAYDSRFGITEAMHVCQDSIQWIPKDDMRVNPEDDAQLELWILLSNAALWHLWKGRCERRFSNIFVPTEEVIKSVWQEMVLTLKARLDSIKGTSDGAMAKRLVFHSVWKKMGFYSMESSSIKWIYKTPRWLFPFTL